LSDSFKDSRLYGFFCELRRRKVYRVAAGYGVVGWLWDPLWADPRFQQMPAKFGAAK
jgi:hypothetical protein